MLAARYDDPGTTAAALSPYAREGAIIVPMNASSSSDPLAGAGKARCPRLLAGADAGARTPVPMAAPPEGRIGR